MPRVKIAPSILSADFLHLERSIRLAESGGADWIHLDIMDGHFVPNLTIGPMIVSAIRSVTKRPLDTHLMIQFPDRYLEDFKEAGSDRVTVHVETCPHLHRTVERIRKLGMRPGVTLNPSTPAQSLAEIVPFVDLILVMTVNPGFGGQRFIRTMFRKVAEISSMIERSGREIELEVDGGVDEENARRLVAAGATVLVAGHSIFSHRNIPAAVRRLRRAAEGARPGG